MEDLLIKAATVVAVALAAFSSFPSPAQPDQQTQQSPSAVRHPVAFTQELAMFQEPALPAQPQTQEPAAPQTQPAQQPHVRTVQLQLITGELENKLDSTSARQGDSVVLKTREAVTTPDGTEIPKGSKLVGRVINVRPHSDTAENAQITLQFDRAELKDGQSLPIESVLESVAPSAGESTMDNSGMASMQPATGAAGSAPGSAPGTAYATPGAAASPANPNGANQSAANDHPGLASGTTAQPPDQNAAANSAAPAGSIVARSGNVAIRTTSIPGVLLANNVNGQPFSNASGMLLGARRDIKLDGGTQMVVAVATAPQQGSGMPR